jgi:LuxR family maltose regulon positive regulatory protein
VERRNRHKDNIPYVLKELDQILHARILLARGESEGCLRVAGKLQSTAAKLGRNQVVLEALLLQSLALRMQDNSEQALRFLEQALSIAEPEEYLRVFLDEGSEMAHLLYEAADRGIHSEYAGRILSAFPAARENRRAEGARERLIEPLSQRECEVLQLLAGGSSNKEVARQLFISLPTVKWHTSNIYGKLGVRNRTQAAARARSLGLLPPS